MMEVPQTTQTKASDSRIEARATCSALQLDYLRQFHDEAFSCVKQGLSLEENGEGKAALFLYEQGLRLIDQALSIQTDGPLCMGSSWDEARAMQNKMRRNRLELLERLATLRIAQRAPLGSPSPSESSPPSYEDAIKVTPDIGSTSTTANKGNNHRSQCVNAELQSKVTSLNAAMSEVMESDSAPVTEIPANAQEIFSLPEVQIFFVSPEGYVSAPSYPTSLKIFKFEDKSAASAANRQTVTAGAFLQVGCWIYPLIAGHSPVLQSSYGAYMFPDTSKNQPGAAVGLLLPGDLDEDVRGVFEHIMCELTLLRTEGTAVSPDEAAAEKARLSRRISDGIVKGAELLARGVEFGAERTSNLVHFGAQKLRQKIKPTAQPASVDPRVGQGIRVAKEVSGVAVSISGFVVRKVGEATLSLGRYLAPHVRKHGSVLLSKAMQSDSAKANKNIDDILEVAAGGMRGAATMYVSLESAARMLASSLANETVELVNHKYGDNAGDITNSALHAVGNFTMTAYNVSSLGIKGIAKRTAKNTGKALVEDYQQKHGTEKNPELTRNEEVNVKGATKEEEEEEEEDEGAEKKKKDTPKADKQ